MAEQEKLTLCEGQEKPINASSYMDWWRQNIERYYEQHPEEKEAYDKWVKEWDEIEDDIYQEEDGAWVFDTQEDKRLIRLKGQWYVENRKTRQRIPLKGFTDKDVEEEYQAFQFI